MLVTQIIQTHQQIRTIAQKRVLQNKKTLKTDFHHLCHHKVHMQRIPSLLTLRMEIMEAPLGSTTLTCLRRHPLYPQDLDRSHDQVQVIYLDAHLYQYVAENNLNISAF